MTTKTTAKARPARSYFPALNMAEVLHEMHAATMPGMWAPTDAALAWSDRNRELLDDRKAEEAKVADLMCRKCGGRGRIIAYTHRHQGECYPCKGSGWSAKGRRYAKTLEG